MEDQYRKCVVALCGACRRGEWAVWNDKLAGYAHRPKALNRSPIRCVADQIHKLAAREEAG